MRDKGTKIHEGIRNLTPRYSRPYKGTSKQRDASAHVPERNGPTTGLAYRRVGLPSRAVDLFLGSVIFVPELTCYTCADGQVNNSGDSSSDEGLDDMLCQNYGPIGHKMAPSKMRHDLDTLAMEASSSEMGFEVHDGGEYSCSESDADRNEGCSTINLEEIPAASGKQRSQGFDASGLQADKRGKYDRTGTGQRLAKDVLAGNHWQLIEDKCLGEPCVPGDCINNGQCGAHCSFGTTRFTRPKAAGSAFWRDLVRQFVTYDADDKAVFNIQVARRATCEDFTRVAYSVPRST
eukprot:3275177-Pleurochrysis_carterae.AAC.2